MTAPHADQLIDGYLARLSDAARDLPKGSRSELLDDMRAHIAEARAREANDETDATILNILDRLGEPSVVVADARERLGLQAAPPYQPGLLEIGALVLMLVAWPIGVILLWTSPAWKRRDKVLGILLPPGGYLSFFVIGAMASGTARRCGAITDAAGVVHSTCTPGPSGLEQAFGVILFAVLLVLPLLTLAYLAIRLRWGRRPALRAA
ncbi:MAG: hypothetical protein ABI401_10665 [Candidatus Dormibacter sp.]